MGPPEFTARNVAKFAAKMIVQGRISQFAENLMVDYTRFDEDDTTTNIISTCVGWGAAAALKPVTDKVVDKTADFIAVKREARRNRQNNEETEK